MSDHRALELLVRLVRDDPWSQSTEGLDDCCTHCGNWTTTYDGHIMHRWHNIDCVWYEAAQWLGLLGETPGHHRVSPASPTP